MKEKMKFRIYQCNICKEKWEDVEDSKVECCFHDKIIILAEKEE